MTKREYLFLAHGGLDYALPMDEVEQILSDGVYAPVPCARPQLWGVCCWERRLYPVVSLTDSSSCAPIGVLCRRDGAAAVFFADEMRGMGPLPEEAEHEAAPGIGRLLRTEARMLWLPCLEEMTVGGVEWT